MAPRRRGRRPAPLVAFVALASGLVASGAAAHRAPTVRSSATVRALSSAPAQASGSCAPGPVPPTTTTTTTTTVPVSTTTTTTTVPVSTTTTYPGETTTTYPGETTTTYPGETTTTVGPTSAAPTLVVPTTYPGETTTTVPVSTTTTYPGETTTTTVPVSTTTTYPGETTTTYPGETTTTTVGTKAPAAYYLFETDGAVVAYGGADDFGSTASTHLPPVVAAAATPDGGGYWMATVSGDVYHFGDARFYGSPVHGLGKARIVAMASTPDGQGYWLVTASGNVFNYGDAPFCGSRASATPSSPVVAFAATPDGQGYWLVTASGIVYNYGDAGHFGSEGRAAPRSPVVAFAPTPNGKGYWLVTGNGGVYNYGDAQFYGSAVHLHFPPPVVAIAATADGAGYWLATKTGRVFHFGDAHYAGSLLHSPPPRSVSVSDILRASPGVPSPARSPFPPGELGFDLSNFQCAKGASRSIQANVPRRSGIAVLQVVGWLDSSFNSCLASEVAWAQRASGGTSGSYSLYLFVNSPGATTAASLLEQSGPAGICSTVTGAARRRCAAYNYGYNGAENALAYADNQGVAAKVWWLDVENANLSTNAFSNLPVSYWSDSKALNAETIQGALDALRHAGIIAGIYSTSLQFATIAGRFVPSGPTVPLWVAGVPWTHPPYAEPGLFRVSVLASWCAGTAIYPGTKTTDVFAGGVPWLLQETPGQEASPYGLDPDYSC